MTWDGIVAKVNRNYIKKLMTTPIIEAYMQFIVIKKTMESILFDFRRRLKEIIGEQFPEFCNELEISEVIEETKVNKKDDHLVAKQKK